MFAGLFKRKVKTPVGTALPEFMQVRSAYGFAFHVIRTNVNDDLFAIPALCGYEGWVMGAGNEFTAEDIKRAHEAPSATWYFCKGCVREFKALNA